LAEKEKSNSYTIGTTLKTKSHSSFCFCGKSKSGRTTMAASFPKPIWLDFDHGLETVSDRDDLRIKLTPGEKTSKIMQKILLNLQNKSGPFKELSADDYPKTLIVDTGSSFSWFLEEEVKRYGEVGKSPRSGDGDGLYQGDYCVIHTRIEKIIRLSKELEMNVIWIFNIAFYEDPDYEGIFESPTVTGKKLSPGIPSFFNEVYYFKSVPIKNKESSESADGLLAKYMMIFTPTNKFPYAGTKTKGTMVKKFPKGRVVNPTWDKIEECFLSKKKKSTKSGTKKN